MKKVSVRLVSSLGHRLPLSMEKTKYESLLKTMAEFECGIDSILLDEAVRLSHDDEPLFFTPSQCKKIAGFFRYADKDYFNKIVEA